VTCTYAIKITIYSCRISELTADRLDRLRALIDDWITDVRAHAAEPETTTET
jgi:hypothetical protein